MANFFDPSQPFDPASFNYATESDKVKRKRAMAEALMQAKQPGTSTVPGGPNGFVVKNSALSNLGPMIQQIMGGYLSGKADDAQKDVDTNSQAALASQMQGLSAGVRDPNQDAKEAAAQMLRESRRGQQDESAPDAGEPVGAQTFPVAPQSPDTSTPLPAAPVKSVSTSAKTVASKALSKGGIDVGSFNPGKDSQAAFAAMPNGGIVDPNKPSDTSILAPGAWDNIVSIGSSAKKKLAEALSAVQHFTGADGSTPNIAPTAPVAPPATPAASPALPAMPQGQAVPPPQAAPPMPAPQAQAPAMPAPPAPAAPPAAQQPQMNPNIVAQNDADPYSKAPDQATMVARLAALAKTGPEGAAIAQAQMNQMFASKNGRFSTTVHSDPVNGGFVQVTTDTQTGQSQVKPIEAGGGREKVLESKISQDGKLIERTSKGWRPAQMQGGGGVMTNEGQGQEAKQADAKLADQTKITDMKSARDNLMQLVPLIQKVGTGRLNTPWNNVKAYVSDSTDLDNMNRLFNSQQLTAAVETLKGQGSISDGERKILASSQFDPKASTQSNLDYANKVISILNKHLPLAEQNFTAKYSDGAPSTSAQPPKGAMYTWQK